MADLLTKGFFEEVLRRGHKVTSAKLQILAMKEIQANDRSVRRYRMQLSDGQHTYPTCMYTGSQDMCSDGFPIINVNQYQVQDLPKASSDPNAPPKKLLVVVDFDVLNVPGEKIGAPTVYNPTQAPLMSMNPAPQAPPAQSAQPHRPAASAVPHTAAGQQPRASVSYGSNQSAGVFPISALTPYQNKWKIRARVTNKSDIRTWANARGEGKLFSMDLADETGEIRCTAFKAECDKFYSIVQLNNVYFISGGQIKQANKKFTSIRNDYEITLSANSEIIPCYDQAADSIPTHLYNFTSFGKLESSVGETVDVIGILKTVADPVKITTKKQEEVTKRELVLVDQDLKSVSMTLWGDKAEKLEVMPEVANPVIAFKGVGVREFQGGIQLSALPSSQYEVAPDQTKSHELRQWWDTKGYLQETSSISGAKQGAGGGGQVKCVGVAELARLGSSQQTPDYFNMRATVTMINKNSDNVLYKACAKENCNKKVVELGPKSFRCEKCQADSESYKYRALLSIQVADFTGSHWLSLFTESVETMTGVQVNELGRLKEQDEAGFDRVFNSVLWKKFLFRIRAKTEIYNDETRIKWTVQTVKTSEVDAEIKQLQDVISKLEMVP